MDEVRHWQELSTQLLAAGVDKPILQMHYPLNANLRDILDVEQDVRNDRQAQQDRRGYREQERVQVRLARRPGRRDADGLQNEVLESQW
jgi:hypothetical protein